MAEGEITTYPNAISILETAIEQSLLMTAQEVLNRERNSGKMPFNTGNLQNESTHVDDSQLSSKEVQIVSDAPYSRRLYFNPQYNFRQDKNPNAGGEWWEDWITGDKKKQPQEIFAEFLKNQSGGYIK